MDWPRRSSISSRWMDPSTVSKNVKSLIILVIFVVSFSIFMTTKGRRAGAFDKINTNPCHFPAIFNFGDSNSDTGGKSAAFHRLPSPNGDTFFHKQSGRYCDGRVILDFVAEKLGLPFLSAYLDSIGTNFRHGTNFATGGSTIQPLDTRIFEGGFSPISLDIQLLQFEQFKARTMEIYDEGASSDVKSSLPRPEDFSKALYIFDIGQNDLHSGFKSMTQKELEESIPRIISQFSQAVEVNCNCVSESRDIVALQLNALSLHPQIDSHFEETIFAQLYQHGARTFWIHNTGPIGCLPYSIIYYPPKPGNMDKNGCIKSHNKIAQIFNRQLKDKVSQLRLQLIDAVFTYVDIYSAKYSLISEAKQHGFTDPFGYCCGHYGEYRLQCGKKAIVNGTELAGAACSNPQSYISWDGIHYSQAANQWVADKIIDGSLSNPPRPLTRACPNPSIWRKY